MRKSFLPFYKPSIGEEEINEVVNTLRSGWLTMGTKTIEFEQEFATFLNSKYAISVSSCTAAMHLTLLAYGIKEGDEVITTPYTFVATAEAILYTGATPLFVDISEDTLNIDVTKIESHINERTRAIMPVHIAGHPCDMDEIMELARKYNLIVVEDAAHALPAHYKGRKIGTIGEATCFSFYATKNITTGEGGMVTTNDETIAERVRLLRLHGMSRDAWERYGKHGSWYYEIVAHGYKYNSTDIQAAIGIAQLRKLDEMQKKRKEYVEMYNEAFADVEAIITPRAKDFVEPSWHLYIIQVKPELLTITRDQFIDELHTRNIGSSVHFIPLHLMPLYREAFGFKKGDFPVAEKVYERVISLPLYSSLTIEDVNDVIEAVLEIIRVKKR